MKTTHSFLLAALAAAGLGACAGDVTTPEGPAEPEGEAAAELSVTGPSPIGDVTVVVPPEAAPVKGPVAGWRAVPGLSGAIQSAGVSDLAVTVTAEMFGTAGAYLRARVDGAVWPVAPLFMAPGQGRDDVRAFTFIVPGVVAGQHTVEIEWQTATAGVAPEMRDRSLTMHSAAEAAGRGRLAVNQSPAAYAVSPDVYNAVPGTVASLETAQDGPLAVTFSADVDVASGRLFVQAVVDGAVVSDVLFGEGGGATRRGARAFTFVTPSVAAGAHRVELRARAEGGAATLFARTVVVASAPPSDAAGGMVAAGSQVAPTAVTSSSYVDLPGLSTWVFTSAGASTAVVEAGGEVLVQGGRLFLRALVDGAPARPSNVTFLQNEPAYRAQSYAFAVDNLTPGWHSVRVQAAVDAGARASLGDRFVRAHHARRSGAAFVQPYGQMRPKQGSFETLVVCFDPLRPDHARPTKAQVRNAFEGPDGGASGRGWWAENSGGRLRAGTVRYLGCEDGNWYVAPPGRQGNWYWDNGAFELMWQDALRAADPSFDFHARDTNKNNNVDADELLVAIVRPQNAPYGTTRGTSVALDGQATPLGVHLSDLYLSSFDGNRTWGVGTIGHEFSHSLNAAQDIYSPCPPETNASSFSIMSWHGNATHLDPWHKLKSGFVTPDAIEISTWATRTLALPAVERGRREVTVLYDPAKLDREYFVVENRLGSDATATYDAPLGNNVVLWHVIEDAATRNAYPTPATNPGCRIPVRFLRALSSPGASYDLAWADGTPAKVRVTLRSPVGATTDVEFAKLP
jgi:M6 family metalloprotease-like protein